MDSSPVTHRTPQARAEVAIANRLLSSLDEDLHEVFVSNMQTEDLDARQILYKPGERIREIYFPDTCVLAMMTVMRDGATIEATTVGREGASWLSASLKSQTMPCETIVAVAGRARKVPSPVVERAIKQNGRFHDALSEYSHALLVQTLRSSACNALHSLEQRCSRWILMTLDRTDMDRFGITHEFLASLLGVQRSSVSVLVERLASEGMLEISRGQIRVADRKRLEQVACECYEVVKKYYEGLDY